MPRQSPPKAAEPITRELRRFQLLISRLREVGVSQAEMARRTGIDSTHINRLANAEKYGYTGLSADIVRKVRDGLKISSEYFFEKLPQDADPDPLANVYSLDAEREKVWKSSINDAVHELLQHKHATDARLLELQAALVMKDREIDRLKHELERERSAARPRTRRPG